MGRFNFKATLLGLTTVLMASSLFATATQRALVDDNNDGTNANEFECYWYYYDDNSGVKADDRPQAGPSTKASVINVPFVEKPREKFGDKSDTWPVKDYTFTLGEEAGDKFATMPFTYGEVWTASYGDANPYVGMGTMLAPDGKYINLTGATGITFKIKSRKAGLTIDFKVETYDITMDSSYTYYQKAVPVTTTWSEVPILLADLLQPAWTPAASEFAFDQTKVTKLAWEVAAQKNKSVTADTLDIDNVYVEGFTFVSPTVRPNDAPLGQTNGRFSDFEGEYKNATSLGTYWYAYKDQEIGGTSQILAGATTDSTKGLLNLKFDPGSGSDNTGHAPYLEFKLGKSVKQFNAVTGDTATVQGFVGIGVNLYDSSTSTYFNAATGKRGTKGATSGSSDGIYFEYLYDGDPKYMTLEISDKNDVGDATTPTRKDSRGSGIVWYANYQKTGLTWKAVSIKFADLITHSDWKGYVAIPLDLANLAKVQFKVQGAENLGGKLFVDNLAFPGLVFPGVGVTAGYMRSTPNAAFKTAYANGSVQVNWKQTGLTSGKISIVNTKGAVVQCMPVAATSELNVKLPAGNLSTGRYFVTFKGIDASGKTVTQQNAITIVK